jgi:ribosomal protein L30/L7E
LKALQSYWRVIMISLESKSNYELYRELQSSLGMIPQVGEIILLRDIVKMAKINRTNYKIAKYVCVLRLHKINNNRYINND